MPYKLCPYCSEVSYSGSNHGVWECPYCGKDITKTTPTDYNPLDAEGHVENLEDPNTGASAQLSLYIRN